MGKRYFNLRFFGEATIELDDQVIDVVDDEWRKDLYNLKTPEDIAEMVGRCMVWNRADLSDLDGWADQPDSNARVIYRDWETDSVEEIEKPS